MNDVYVAFAQASQRYPEHHLREWQDAEEAEQQFTVRYRDGSEEEIHFKPDALLFYDTGRGTLAVFVEADRGTERGPERFAEKVRRYVLLDRSGKFKERYGLTNFRVLTIVRTERRLWALKEVIEVESPPEHYRRFWLGLQANLTTEGLTNGRWWRVREELPQAFLPS